MTKVTTPHQPTQPVAKAMSRYTLDPAQLGPAAKQAWFALLGPIVGAATRKAHEAHAWAHGFLLQAQELLGALSGLSDPEAVAVLEALQTRWKGMRQRHE